MRGTVVAGYQPVWVDVRCPWCMALLGARIGDRTVSGIGLIRSHRPECPNLPAQATL